MLVGRSLPYGEGVTYWPLAEMVKAAAGITDDDDRAEAQEKLMVFCEDEAVADLLAARLGRPRLVRRRASASRRSQWAVREWASELADVQPLVLVFEDIHWAEEPLLELIEHLAGWVREAPLLILCLARPELLDAAPVVGRRAHARDSRSSSSRSDAATREELASALTADTPLTPEHREAVLDDDRGEPALPRGDGAHARAGRTTATSSGFRTRCRR